MPRLLIVLLSMILVTPVWAADTKTEGDCAPIVMKNRANKVTVNVDCDRAPTIVSWEKGIYADNVHQFDAFMEKNDGKIVKIDADLGEPSGSKIFEYDADSKKCVITHTSADYGGGDKYGTNYWVDCDWRRVVGYRVNGFFTQEFITARTYADIELTKVADGIVLMRNPKIVPYKP